MNRSDPDKPTLVQYAAAEPGVTRRGFRLLLLLTFINTILLGAYVMGPGLQVFAKQQWAAFQEKRRIAKALEWAKSNEQLALNLSVPSGQLMYAEDIEGITLMEKQVATASAEPFGQVVTAHDRLMPNSSPAPYPVRDPQVLENPKFLATFADDRFDSTGGPLFIYKRTTPSGETKLVIVRVISSVKLGDDVRDQSAGSLFNSFVRSSRTLVITTRDPVAVLPGGKIGAAVHSISRATYVNPPEYATLVTIDRTTPPRTFVELHGLLRFYAGQPDPNDPSRFTIRYTLDDEEGLIDCRLKDETVTITETGPLAKARLQGGSEPPLAPPPPSVRTAKPGAPRQSTPTTAPASNLSQSKG